MKHEVIYIGGMMCQRCRNIIEKALNNLEGVKNAKVSYEAGKAEITFDPSEVSLKEINSAIEGLGYFVSQKKTASSFQRAACFFAIIIVLFVLLDYFGVLNLLVPSQLADSAMGFGMLFVTGLITSVHCIAMCGGINLSQSLPRERAGEEKTSFMPSVLYNLGRVISYTVIGFILGFAGMIIGGGSNAGISVLLQGVLKIIAGVFMIIMGLNMLNLFPYLRKLSVKRFGGSGMLKLKGKGPMVVGLLNGLMPCGPLQSMEIVAFASANPFVGALSMLMFSLGTVPLMLGLGSLVSLLGRKFAHAVTQVGSLLVVVLGLAMLSQGGNLSGLFSFRFLLEAVAALAVIGTVSIMPWKKSVRETVCFCVCAAFFAIVCCYPYFSSETEVSSAEISDGVQIVRSTLEPGDYPDITVQLGMPVKWIIDAPQGSINGCNGRVIIREYGIEYAFKEGENIIEFTPDEAGNFSYSCWMGMIHGNIYVTE